MDYNTVQRVEIKDYKRAAATLAAAFIEDPVTLYFCRHPHTLSKRQVQQRNEYTHPIQGMLIVQGYDGVYHLCAYPQRRGLSDWGLWRCRTMVRNPLNNVSRAKLTVGCPPGKTWMTT